MHRGDHRSPGAHIRPSSRHAVTVTLAAPGDGFCLLRTDSGKKREKRLSLQQDLEKCRLLGVRPSVRCEIFGATPTTWPRKAGDLSVKSPGCGQHI